MTSLLRNSSDVTNILLPCVEYIKLDTCAQFHDHRSHNSKVMMTDGSKKQCQIELRKILNTQLTFFLIFSSKIIIDLRFTTRAVSFFFNFELSIPSKMPVGNKDHLPCF